MAQFGIFNDEGMIDGPYDSRVEAQEAARDHHAEEDYRVLELCPDHEGEPNASCEPCLAEEN